MTDLLLEGLPYKSINVGRYCLLQQNEPGTAWVQVVSRFTFGDVVRALWPVDLSKPTRIVRVKRGRVVSVVRSWN